MNAKLTALFVAITVLVPSMSDAGQAVGTAKARGDFRPFSQSQQSVARSTRNVRPAYRYSGPSSAPMIAQTPVIREESSVEVAQAPAEARRFSQAPAAAADSNVASATPCPPTPSVAGQPDSGRRYSYAPAPQTSASPMRSYSSNAGRSSQPAWTLQKTAPGKYSTR